VSESAVATETRRHHLMRFDTMDSGIEWTAAGVAKGGRGELNRDRDDGPKGKQLAGPAIEFRRHWTPGRPGRGGQAVATGRLAAPKTEEFASWCRSARSLWRGGAELNRSVKSATSARVVAPVHARPTYRGQAGHYRDADASTTAIPPTTIQQ
jgi:hypothetical protein